MRIKKIIEDIKDEIIYNFNVIYNAKRNAAAVGQVKFCLDLMDTQLDHLKNLAEHQTNDKAVQTAMHYVEYWRAEVEKAIERKLL